MASKLASAIVKQSRQRDLPILLQVIMSPTVSRKRSPMIRSLWYVIEEKEKPPAEQQVDNQGGGKEIGTRKWQQLTTTATVSSSSFHKGRVGRREGGKGISTAAHGIGVGDRRNQEIFTCRDTIRRVSLPGARINFRYMSGLVAFNSQLYLIGGDIDKKDSRLAVSYSSKHDPPPQPKFGVAAFRCCDLKEERKLRWQRRPNAGCLYLVDTISATAHRGGDDDDDGWVYAVGCANYLVHLPSGRFKELPLLPSSIGKPMSTLICVAKKKLFVYTRPYNKAISCYDPESDKWEVLDGRFFGNWSNGVALFDDRFFFVYSNCNPMVDNITDDENPAVGGIYIFDVERRKWLPTPVEGLDDKGVFKEYYHLRLNPHLVHIGMHTLNGSCDLPKLALVWQPETECPDNYNRTLSWSKFIIQHDQSTCCFRAQLLSKEEHTLSDSAVWVVNCKALHHSLGKSGPAKGTE